MEKMVTISETEYRALKAAAELAGHPEVMARTILAMRPSDRKISLEVAFPEVNTAIRAAATTVDAAELYEDQAEGSHS